jgi:hypothetical protein
MEKKEGQKSRGTIPLTKYLLHPSECVEAGPMRLQVCLS